MVFPMSCTIWFNYDDLNSAISMILLDFAMLKQWLRALSIAPSIVDVYWVMHSKYIIVASRDLIYLLGP